MSNTKNNPPYIKIEYFMDEMIEGGISRIEFLKRENVNLKEIKNYWDNLVNTKVVCYIQGNINEYKSKIINNKFNKFVKNKYILTIDDMKIVKNVGEEVSFVGVNEYKYENNNVMAYVCQLGYEKIEDNDIWLNNHCCLYYFK
jgi:secreted Zn-dependent insulinase-like peptidase